MSVSSPATPPPELSCLFSLDLRGSSFAPEMVSSVPTLDNRSAILYGLVPAVRDGYSTHEDMFTGSLILFK